MAVAGPLDAPHLRRVLLGLEGPYADPRVATDPLDNVDVLVASLDPAERTAMAGSLVLLVVDDDAVVATGAVLALDKVRDAVDVEALQRMLGEPIAALDRAPVGFVAAHRATLRGELAVLVARSVRAGVAAHVPIVDELVAEPDPAAGVAPGLDRADLVTELAASVPELVVAMAAAGRLGWLGPEGTGALIVLSAHAQRVALARSVGTWSTAAAQRVRAAAAWRHWPAAEVGELLAAMGYTSDPAGGTRSL